MTRGKQWTAQEETELKAQLETNTPLEEIAQKLNKSRHAIQTKSKRLGLELHAQGCINRTIQLPRELPSVEKTLRILAGALDLSVKPGLTKEDIKRLQIVAMLAKAYSENVARYVNYREIEKKLEQMEELNAKLFRERGSDCVSRSDASQMGNPPK